MIHLKKIHNSKIQNIELTTLHLFSTLKKKKKIVYKKLISKNY